MYSVGSALPVRLLHISDLHAGSAEETDVERGLSPLIERVGPELIVVTGDLAHRGRRREHERAAAYLRGLGQPRPNRRGEARGLHVYEARDDALLVQTYVWREDDWGLTATRRFPRGREPLRTEPA